MKNRTDAKVRGATIFTNSQMRRENMLDWERNMIKESYKQESCELVDDAFKENQRTSKSQTTDLERVAMVRYEDFKDFELTELVCFV